MMSTNYFFGRSSLACPVVIRCFVTRFVAPLTVIRFLPGPVKNRAVLLRPERSKCLLLGEVVGS